MTELPIKATLKAGTGYDAPWVTVDAADPNDLAFKLKALAEGEALQSVVEAANMLKAANNAAPLLPGGAEAAASAAPAPVQQQQPAGWGNSAPAAAPQWSGAQQQAAPSGPVNGSPHPEGIKCPLDGNVVQYNKAFNSKAGKALKMWACPQQRSKGDGHDTVWVD